MPAPPPSSHEIDPSRYRHLTELLGIQSDGQEPRGIRQLLELLLATRDAEGSRQVVSAWNAVQVPGAADVLTLASATVGAGLFWVVESCHVTHNDPTDRETEIHLLNPGVFESAQLIQDMTLSTNQSLIVPRRFIVPAGWAIEARIAVLTAGDLLNMWVSYWELTVGDYLVIP